MTREFSRKPISGALMLTLDITLFFLSILLYIAAGTAGRPLYAILGTVCVLAVGLISAGFFIVNPNQATVLVFFGKYVGSTKENGFWWANPFTVRKGISLRARNLNGERLKVNDKAGNPIEIAAVVVWHVENTAQAVFDVDDYEEYVTTQSESAVRHLATSYPYDTDDSEPSLRGDIDTVSEQLERELQERLGRAGVRVTEARLSHLAYASEIAGAMLQRQQAAAIIAARAKIVEGAVSMVEGALEQLGQRHVIELDEDPPAPDFLGH